MFASVCFLSLGKKNLKRFLLYLHSSIHSTPACVRVGAWCLFACAVSGGRGWYTVSGQVLARHRFSVEDSVASDDSVAMRARRGVESTGGRGGRPDAISRRWRQFYCPRPPTSHAVWAAAATMCTPNHCRLVCQSKKQTNNSSTQPTTL